MTNQFKAFMHGTPSFDVHPAFREMAENSVNQVRQTYEQFKANADGANGAIEASYAQAAKGVTAYQAKLLDIVHHNTDAMFDFTSKLFGVKSLQDMTSLWSDHARIQAETLASQSRELADLGQKLATDSIEPLKESATKAFKVA